ncbi:MAG TPA: hypothetical protein VGE21_10990 [Flavobacteriales bacterium]
MKERVLARTMARAAWIAALVLSACRTDPDPEDDQVVAEAYDQRLYRSDLRQVIPLGTPPEDSSAMARRFMDNWARERVVLRKAEDNLDEADKNVEDRLRSYRESLITYAYEQALVAQKLDTAVSDAEIAKYYEENRKNFELKDNIVRARWFKIRGNDAKLLRKVNELWGRDTDDDRHELEVLLARQGSVINDTHEAWIEFKELQQHVPVRPENPTDWLPRHARFTEQDSSGTYFVDIIEHRLKDSVSPLALAGASIRSILINQRKLQLIARMREDLYHEALANKEVRIR